MIKISICICTRNRPESLKKLLNSIENIKTPHGTNIKIIVVENDLKNYSERIIKELKAKSKFNISYYLESRQGISYARNRSIKEANDCDFCCFVDDDQMVDPNWLLELLKCQQEFDADGVYGSTPPIFNKEVPSYIKKYHTRPTYPYGSISNDAATGCLLLRKKFLDMIDGPFNIRLNFTGGEDIFLTSQINKLGGIICNNPD